MMFWKMKLMRMMGAACMALPMTSADCGGMDMTARGSGTAASPGRRMAAKEPNRPTTSMLAALESLGAVCVPTRAAKAAAQTVEATVGSRPRTSAPISPAFMVPKARTSAFLTIEMVAMTSAPQSISMLASVKALKELGASSPDDSRCLMATSAMSRPDSRLMAYRAKKRPVEMPIPAPATSSGSTSMPAPTVLLVMSRLVHTTGTKKSPTNDGMSMPDGCPSAP
mmetsp:Transcript_8097/g.23284  ORF Transcript_8097/g.23284 Transcript_8097/m.23284 type:complete len:225 (-) Transcript_8097:521-1195(-)